MTQLEQMQDLISGWDWPDAPVQAIDAVMELLADWSLQRCTARSRPQPTYGVCQHCVAEEILTEIGKAIEVDP